MIKKLLLLLVLPCIVLSACNSKDTPGVVCDDVVAVVPARDSTALANYIITNNITATYDPDGYYYSIQNAGDSIKPDKCSSIQAYYEGRLTNGYIFDSNNNASLNLSTAIKGWRLALPKIGTTGEMKLYIPAALGYGNTDQSGIPGGSILIFTIKLIKIN